MLSTSSNVNSRKQVNAFTLWVSVCPCKHWFCYTCNTLLRCWYMKIWWHCSTGKAMLLDIIQQLIALTTGQFALIWFQLFYLLSVPPSLIISYHISNTTIDLRTGYIPISVKYDSVIYKWNSGQDSMISSTQKMKSNQCLSIGSLHKSTHSVQQPAHFKPKSGQTAGSGMSTIQDILISTALYIKLRLQWNTCW